MTVLMGGERGWGWVDGENGQTRLCILEVDAVRLADGLDMGDKKVEKRMFLRFLLE